MLLLDLDDLKMINDVHGHAGGDTALKHLTSELRSNCRSSDPCGRIGGDEFALFLHHTSMADARQIAEKLMRSIAARPAQIGATQTPISISIGLASGPTEVEELLRRADAAMYAAKRAGKNQVAVFQIDSA